MEKILKCFTIIAFGCMFYGTAEVLGRGYSHITMGALGGVAFLVIHELCGEILAGRLRPIEAMLISTMFITSSELLAGEILNRYLGMKIWNYSTLPLNFDGQICPIFSVMWFMLSLFGIFADKGIRRYIFCEAAAMAEKQQAAADTSVA